MEIRFTTSVAGVNFAYDEGEVAELADGEAMRFVRANQAVPTEERAMLPVPERAVKHRGRFRAGVDGDRSLSRKRS